MTDDVNPIASSGALLLAEPPNVVRGAINLRIDPQVRQLIDDAAAILGKTRTEFMVEAARRQAIDVLLDQRLFELDPDRFGAFIHALDNPPAPGSKLRQLLGRTPAWRN